MADDPFFFDEAAADRVVRFFSRHLRNTEAEWAGTPLTPQPWQADRILRPLFGAKRRADGLRRYRTAYVEVPKKNGKTTLSAGLALFLLVADDEPGAQIFSAAADKDQARLSFDAAKKMVLASPALLKRCKVYRNAIEYPATGSVYRVLSADAGTKDGVHPHAVIFDEVHRQKGRDLWDVLTKGQVTRRQPLTLAITTAGFDKQTLCGELHDYAENVRDGAGGDPTFLPVIYGAAPEDDWTKPATWAKANPSLGVTVKEDALAMECARAMSSPRGENSFRRFHLNQWTEQEERWISMLKWDACGTQPIDEAALRGRRCFMGMDLSSKLDITAVVYVFPRGDGSYDVLPRFWIPKEDLQKRSEETRTPYDAWARSGLINPTPGNYVDYDFIEAQVRADAANFEIEEGAFDPWNAQNLVPKLRDGGIEMVECGQGFKSMSEPTKELEARVVSKRIHHGGNPVLRWMASNAVVVSDAAGNQKITKPGKNSPKKVDGIVALVMAMYRAIAHEPKALPKARVHLW